MASEDDILAAIEAEQQERRERVRAILLEAGRPELLAQYEQKMRDIDLGIDSARATWAALSEPQRGALREMAKGHALMREPGRKTYALGLDRRGIRVATVRNLASRELVTWDGGAFDPEARAVLAERGRFVLRHGPGGEA